MKNSLIISVLAAFFAGLLIAGCTVPGENAKEGRFSISPTVQVCFAHGNVADDGRTLCTNQWDYGGLFGWGTGANPNLTTDDSSAYATFDDWGNYIDGGWRTLTADEWEYILEQRPNAKEKLAGATVNDVHGLVLLPDEWTMPEGCSFNPQATWDANIYTAEQWNQMENNGAIFLPAAGCRYGTENPIEGKHLSYSTSTPESGYKAVVVCCASGLGVMTGITTRSTGQSVRLAKDI